LFVVLGDVIPNRSLQLSDAAYRTLAREATALHRSEARPQEIVQLVGLRLLRKEL